jgi:hypothetical protein
MSFLQVYMFGPSPALRYVIAAAVSIIAVGILVTRFTDKVSLSPGPKAEPGGKSIVIGGKTYGLATRAFQGFAEHWILSVPVGAPHTFSVQREDGLEWLIDHLGVMAKVSSGDTHYDDEFEIRSHDAAWTKTFFSDPENRRLVQALFGLDAVTVILSGGRLQACFAERDSLEEGGSALSDLAARLPSA